MNTSMATSEGQTIRWYVMRHLNPERIERRLQEENVSADNCQRLLYEYFIPFRFLSRITVRQKDRVEDNGSVLLEDEYNSLRDHLHDFVFIRTTEQGIRQLLQRPWNTEARVRLCHYRDRQRQAITVAENLMRPFIEILCEQRIRFTLGLPVDTAVHNDLVTINTGLFKGHTAYIVDILHTSDGISLTLGINMFGGMKSLQLPGFREDEVTMQKDVNDIIGCHFITNIEELLLEILSHRLNRQSSDEDARQDAAILNRICHYSYIRISQPDVRRRFMALMLICAYLRYDEQACHSFAAIVQVELDATPADMADTRTYLMIALYIAQRNVQHRTAAKEYIQQHPDCPIVLRRLMSIAKRLRCR